MSKLYDKYLFLKKNENKESSSNLNTLYLFKCGAFFIFLDQDAIIVSEILSQMHFLF